ncbi:MAG: hypothetical protein M3Q91_09345 [Acidobacteriota bacterium]|nr:hypothetical protein [Acidobacteriota bacterium]
MNDRDHHHRTSSDAHEEHEDQSTEQPSPHRGLRLVPTPPSPVTRTPADEELRALLQQFKRRAKHRKKPGDDPPPAA